MTSKHKITFKVLRMMTFGLYMSWQTSWQEFCWKMAEKEPVVSRQPQSVSSFTSENSDSKGKCIQLLESTERFIIQRKVVDNEGNVTFNCTLIPVNAIWKVPRGIYIVWKTIDLLFIIVLFARTRGRFKALSASYSNRTGPVAWAQAQELLHTSSGSIGSAPLK